MKITLPTMMAAAALAFGIAMQSASGDTMSSESAILANIGGMTKAFEAGEYPAC